jgi:hypothetical protein
VLFADAAGARELLGAIYSAGWAGFAGWAGRGGRERIDAYS